MWLDNAAFFTDFAIDLTVDGVAVRGVFDNPYAAAFGGMVGGSGPQVFVPSETVVSRGSAVVIGAKTYTVTGIEPDGTGITLLRLDDA
jgi:hypothetical protein